MLDSYYFFAEHVKYFLLASKMIDAIAMINYVNYAD